MASQGTGVADGFTCAPSVKANHEILSPHGVPSLWQGAANDVTSLQRVGMGYTYFSTSNNVAPATEGS